MSNPNANVRKFDGAVNAAAYWIYDHLLRAGDIVNDSTVTGTTVKAALNTLSAASSAVFPFVAAGLAEQDLVSYDAGAATWRNRTKVAALKGTGTDSLVVGTGSLAAGTNDIILGPSAGNVLNAGSNNIGIGLDTLDGATVALANIVAIGGSALSGALTAAANGCVGVGSSALNALTSGDSHVAVGYQAGDTLTTGTGCVLLGYGADVSAPGAIGRISIGANVSNTIDNSLFVPTTLAAVGAATSSLGFDSATGQIGTIALAAVVPYVSANTTSQGLGTSAFAAITSGTQDTGSGYQVGANVTTGSRNSLFGYTVNSAAGENDNTFIGNAVGNSSVGSRNTSVGSLSFNSAAAAVTDCVAIGYSALSDALTTAASGTIAIGSYCLLQLTSGAKNTAVGHLSAFTLTTGSRNTFFGYSISSSNAADDNTLIGDEVGSNNSGSRNTAVGSQAFNSASAAVTDCVAIGYNALSGIISSTAPSTTVAIGTNALSSLTTGTGNVTVGDNSQLLISTGNYNTSLGSYALGGAASAISNCVAFGFYTLLNATAAADGATAVGKGALQSLTSGARTTAVGYQAGNILATGSDMTILGYDADGDNAARSGCVVIGTNALATVDNTLVIRVGNSSTTELTTDLAVTAGVAVAIGAEPYFTIIIGGNPYKIALRS